MRNEITAAGAVAGTTGSGISVLTGWIPQDIGNLACVVGIVLSIIMIYRTWMDSQKIRVEKEILEKKLESFDTKPETE